jgi:toxin HigB-1
VNVAFRTRRLERAFRDQDEALRQWGIIVGRRYTERVRMLQQQFQTVAEIYAARALDFHALTGNRSGQHALRLTGQMRLIVTVVDERSVWIEEVVDYHG